MLKKLLALLLAALMLTSVLTACSKEEAEVEENETITETDTNETTNDETETGETDADNGESDQVEADTPADDELTEDPTMNAPAADPNETPAEPDMNVPAADPNETPSAPVETPAVTPSEPADTPTVTNPVVPSETLPADLTAETVIDAIYNAFDTQLGSLMTMPVDLSDADALRYFTGLTDASVLVEAAVSEPMMSSQAYSMVVLQVTDPSQAESVARQVMAGVDPVKWLCVSAEDMAAAVSGNWVMFVMIDTNFENMDAVDLANTFVSLYGGSVLS